MEKYNVRRRNILATIVLYIFSIYSVCFTGSAFYSFNFVITEMRRSLSLAAALGDQDGSMTRDMVMNEAGFPFLMFACQMLLMVYALVSILRWKKHGFFLMVIVTALFAIEYPFANELTIMFSRTVTIGCTVGTVLTSLLLLLKGRKCEYSAMKMLMHPELYEETNDASGSSTKISVKKILCIVGGVFLTIFVVIPAFVLLLGFFTSEEVTPDWKMYGLKGNVQTVNNVREETNKKWVSLEKDNSTYTLSFDKKGRLTEDEFGDIYNYNKSGKFVGGNHEYTTMKRNAEGLIEEYQDSEPDTDDADGFTLSYTYDADGRMAGMTWNSWYENTERKYGWNEEGHLAYFTDSYTTEDGDAGDITETYEYLSYDEQGNWTQRRVTKVNAYLDHKPIGNGRYKEVTVTKRTYFVESRTISYYGK